MNENKWELKKQMRSKGYTVPDAAQKIGVSPATIYNVLNSFDGYGSPVSPQLFDAVVNGILTLPKRPYKKIKMRKGGPLKNPRGPVKQEVVKTVEPVKQSSPMKIEAKVTVYRQPQGKYNEILASAQLVLADMFCSRFIKVVKKKDSDELTIRWADTFVPGSGKIDYFSAITKEARTLAQTVILDEYHRRVAELNSLDTRNELDRYLEGKMFRLYDTTNKVIYKKYAGRTGTVSIINHEGENVHSVFFCTGELNDHKGFITSNYLNITAVPKQEYGPFYKDGYMKVTTMNNEYMFLVVEGKR